jgi:protein-disulfide isomerase
MGMKRKIWVAAVILGLFFSAPARADVSWSTLRDVNLDKEPLDVTASADGKSVFILLPGEILVYSVQGNVVEKRIPVDKGFERITYSPGLHGLVLTGSGIKSLKILKLQDIHELDVSGLPFMGPENAPVTIAVFSDYQCPFCARLEPTLRQLLEKFPKEVKLVHKNFWLQSHRFALQAARAALAANEQGKFWEFHERLIEIYQTLNEEKINEIAGSLALNMEKFRQDMNSPAIQNILSRDYNEGRRIGIRGIPTIFINGRMAERYGLADLQAMVEEELKGSK